MRGLDNLDAQLLGDDENSLLGDSERSRVGVLKAI